jgi:hypothetical protein
MDESASYNPKLVGVAWVGVVCGFFLSFEQDAIKNKRNMPETAKNNLKGYTFIILQGGNMSDINSVYVAFIMPFFYLRVQTENSWLFLAEL